MRFQLVRAVLAASLLAVPVALTACSGSSAKTSGAERAAQSFLDAVGKRDATTAASLTSAPATAKPAITATLDGLDGLDDPNGAGTAAQATAVFTVTGSAKGTGGAKNSPETVRYSASWSVPGATKRWTYQGSVRVSKHDGDWQVEWAASDLHPQLNTGQHLLAVRVAAGRGALQGSDGEPLFSKQPVVTVGINPAWVKDLTSLASSLASALHISASDIRASVKAAPKDQFIEVITLRKAAYDKVRSTIHDLPGTEFHTGTMLLGPSSGWAQPLLGTVGPATKEVIDTSGGKVREGDLTGLSGLQKALNGTLTGTAGMSIYAANDATKTKLATLTAPVQGKDVRLTLDRRAQSAAETALTDVALPAAIVITQPSTGKILAVANSRAADGDIALDGRFPPGSTFKIVTYTAAFTENSRLTPQTTAPCPGSITVNGQKIHNENSFDKGTISLADAFAYSCNTTAANLGLALASGALVKAARSLGLGGKWNLPVPAFSGSLPEPSGASARNEQAADSYGQGKDLVSPLLMAEIAGAAATGKTVPPSLVLGEQARVSATQPAKVTEYLNTLMRDVVTVPGATGRGLADLPGPVRGKTGTAEFGTDKPPKSHSWFAGTRGDIAFSVFIYGGEGSATGAVPVAHKLLTALPS